MFGKNVEIHGEFELKRNNIYNHGKPYALNIDGVNGETYEAMSQHVTLHTTGATGNKLIGSSLTLCFNPIVTRLLTLRPLVSLNFSR